LHKHHQQHNHHHRHHHPQNKSLIPVVISLQRLLVQDTVQKCQNT
jgi:hypothetical protein